jgi:hypothetical protein
MPDDIAVYIYTCAHDVNKNAHDTVNKRDLELGHFKITLLFSRSGKKLKLRDQFQLIVFRRGLLFLISARSRYGWNAILNGQVQ